MRSMRRLPPVSATITSRVPATHWTTPCTTMRSWAAALHTPSTRSNRPDAATKRITWDCTVARALAAALGPLSLLCPSVLKRLPRRALRRMPRRALPPGAPSRSSASAPSPSCRRWPAASKLGATRTSSIALGGWIVDDILVLVYSESSFRGVEDDEHVVPGVGYDRAEAYLDFERTVENLAAGGRGCIQRFGNRVDDQVSFHRPVAVVEH